MRLRVFGTLLFLVASSLAGQEHPKRKISLDDLAALRELSDPQISPDGAWLAYSVRTADLEEDKLSSDIWMTSWDGARHIRLTSSKETETSPRFSPDGRYLAFLSSREVKEETSQVWLMDRAGGEGRRVTELPGGVEDFAWSPDSTRLVLVASDPDLEAIEAKEAKEKDKPRTQKPIVVDRFQFKEDGNGYLGPRRQHLYLFDLASEKAEILTPGGYNESLPAFSPDGKSIAFVSKRTPDIDRDDNHDVFVIEARIGATARRLTTFEGPDSDPSWGSRPAWSPDGKEIAYLQGGPLKWIYYAGQKLAVIPAEGGSPRILTEGLDRNVSQPTWSEDGRSIFVSLEDDQSVHLARIPARGGPVERLLTGRRVARDFSLGPAGRIAVLEGTGHEAFEVKAVEGSTLRPLSRQNEKLMAQLDLGAVQEIRFESRDGAEVHGFVVKPPDYQPGRKYPTLVRIHGGPVGQDENEFRFDWQFFAGQGYLVVAPNYRGSSGRGEAYSQAIYADWGGKEVDDVLAAVDHLVAQGLADPERLGIGGWSYGGMTTNYAIARDPRFKAAVSGAAISNALSGYGTDQYIREYELELGTPWKNLDAYLKVSYPFFHADRIVTPTLFLCGEKDFNVPLLNSEQMYQALRSLGVPTQLVIYPGQFHGLRKPSYLRDRFERSLAWYDKYLKGDAPAPTGGKVPQR